MNQKYKTNSKVIIANFLMNGSRHDISGIIEEYRWNIQAKQYLYSVRINSVVVRLPEDKLEDYEVFWDKKHAEEKK